MAVRYEETKYGFIFGAAEIKRIHSHVDGWVLLQLCTPRGELQIYVTKTGKVRISDYHGNKEWQGTLTKKANG